MLAFKGGGQTRDGYCMILPTISPDGTSAPFSMDTIFFTSSVVPFCKEAQTK